MVGHHAIASVHQMPVVAVIGWSSFNAQKHVVPELVQFSKQVNVIGFDIHPPAQNFNGVTFIPVSDSSCLAQKLKRLQPDVVLIETPCDSHPKHICIALEAGAKLIVSEKCVGWRVSQVESVLLPTLCSATPEQQIFIIDNYLTLELVLALHANAQYWLGKVKQLEVILFEEQGISQHQERFHFDGMTNFFHHVVALASLFFDLNDLVPVQAAWARHPYACVPDTYRAALFVSKSTGDIIVKGAVGKYVKYPLKIIRVEGERGVAVLDIDTNRLIAVNDGIFVEMCCDRDSGYGRLINSIANGVPLPLTLLSVESAMQVLRLLEEAHKKAVNLPFYPDGCDVVFASEKPCRLFNYNEFREH
ncbi:MAG: hypothetical protein RMK18_06750 [Armatimonadota bacterium]|nr:hypothetical protein [Armatimonadota bacterium]MCX7777538.1 hypothetical protein [Armatimonadota bacterium]MDW8025547.1 hypothetical protein [Armatimonadota bacterium]